MRYLSILLFLSIFASDSYSQIAENAEDISPLLISESIPDVGVVSINGEALSIRDVLKDKPSVLLVYRGGWCPYCNTHLSEVGLAEAEIMDLGYQVIAVSPDSPEKLKMTIENGNFNYTLYSDADGTFTQAMGIAFKSPDRYAIRLADFSDELNPGLLPVPSLFVVDKEGIIVFEFISPDYKQRIGADFLVEVLKQINKEKEEGY